MKLTQRLAAAFNAFRGSPEDPHTSLANPDSWLLDALGGTPSATGIRVSPATAMSLVAVFACIRVLSESLASLPLVVYRKGVNGNKERAEEHPVFKLLHDEFNPCMTSVVGREAMQSHAVGRGNGYALIERSKGGIPFALWPVPADCMEPRLVNRRLKYAITEQGTLSLGIPRGVYESNQIVHIPGLGYDGLIGYSPISLAREAIGLGLAAQEFGGRFFANDSRPTGFLTTDVNLTEQQQRRLETAWTTAHQGVYNAHKMAILSGGLKFQATSVNPDDAQFLEVRKFQVTEVARLFRVPPHIIGDLDRATFSNIEHQSLEFVIHSVRPWLVRWEQELNRKLFTEVERRSYFVKFNVDGLLRGDIKTRFEAYSIALTNGWMNADEVRSLEDMNPLPDGNGKLYYRPANLMEVGAPLPEPAALPAPAGKDDGTDETAPPAAGGKQ